MKSIKGLFVIGTLTNNVRFVVLIVVDKRFDEVRSVLRVKYKYFVFASVKVTNFLYGYLENLFFVLNNKIWMLLQIRTRQFF